MCIRDSPSPAAGQVLVKMAAVSVNPIDTYIRGGAKYWELPCLLYTSDAADERSSVDLGGRRIIKKKNKWRRQHAQQLHEIRAE